MQKRVLVAPLDWGLGHATRCIPIVQELRSQGASVLLATNGQAYELLKQEFPDLPIEKLPAYNIQYAKGNMFWNIAKQLPKIIWVISQEHRQLRKMVQQHKIDIVISDNRYGCFSKMAKSIFVAHQINIQVPNFILQSIIRFINYLFIRQFDACWIPDLEGEKSLAGALAHPVALPNVEWIGVLSRMQPLNSVQKWDVIVVLSGPEPQRTVFEKLIVAQAILLPPRFLLVQGVPNKKSKVESIQKIGKIEIVPFLKAKDLNAAMAASGVVICRSGYSSIMDLAVLGKPAILIPTPGQTEQEYLSERFFKKGIFYTQQQPNFNLAKALSEVKSFSGIQQDLQASSRLTLQTVIRNVLNEDGSSF